MNAISEGTILYILASKLWTKKQEINVWVDFYYLSSTHIQRNWKLKVSPSGISHMWRSTRILNHETEGLKAWICIPHSHYTHWISLPWYGCKTTTAHPSSRHTLGSIWTRWTLLTQSIKKRQSRKLAAKQILNIYIKIIYFHHRNMNFKGTQSQICQKLQILVSVPGC